MDPAQAFMAAAGQHWAGLYAVGSVLFLGACVVLLLHCASSSDRKKRRQIENSDISGRGRQTDSKTANAGKNDVHSAQNRKWQESQKKQPKKKSHFPAVTIVVTPPTPEPLPRSANDGISHNQHAVESKSENTRMEKDETDHDVIRGEDDANNRIPCNSGGGSKMSSSSTSLSGIGDVNFVASEELSSERGKELPPEDIEPRCRLASMEPGTPKSGYCVVTLERTGVIQS